MYDVVIIGGGLAGLINAIQLSGAGLSICLIERKQYPFHKVCGEYISNEVTPFLHAIGAFPDLQEIPRINRLVLSDTRGKAINLSLPLGGFGLSRFVLDDFLYQKAKAQGTDFKLGVQATNVLFEQNRFEVILSDGTSLATPLVIGAFGKRSRLDKSLNRDFIFQRSPYIAVKYHIQYPFPKGTIALYNFKNGYCGINQIEGGKQNLCYLSHRDNLRNTGDIRGMEEEVLSQNPHLKRIFSEAHFIMEKPLVINEISFAPKKAVEDHILMTGDAAGMIAPLCGNGMAMAIHSAKILSELIMLHYRKKPFNRAELERAYVSEWNRNFKKRLHVGRVTQQFFGHRFASAFTVALAKSSGIIARMIIKQTHGKPF